jgi:hypothetical protein
MASSVRTIVYTERIKISPSDMRLFLAGRKKCTVRLGVARVAKPEMFLSDGRKNVPVRIIKVDSSRCFRDLTDQDALDEGFSKREELLADLRHYYPRSRDEDRVTVIHFEPVNPQPTLF